MTTADERTPEFPAISAEQIVDETQRALVLFAREFDRSPTESEVKMIVSAIIRYYAEPNAPSQRLQ
jgi:hypothetical protein